MKLRYSRPHKPSLLVDELLAAIPALRPTDSDGDGKNDVIPAFFESDGTTFILTCLDSVDPAQVAAVVALHDPTKKSLSEMVEDEREAAVTAIRSWRQDPHVDPVVLKNLLLNITRVLSL